MKPQKLEIGLLKYIKSSSNTYGYVELRDFLLYNFPQKSDMAERIEIKRFLKFLEGGEYIEIKSNRGISIIVEAGRAVPRNEISVIAKITPKGLELLEREKNNFLNKFGIISAFGLGVLSLAYSYFESKKSEDLELKINKYLNDISVIESKLKEQNELSKANRKKILYLKKQIDVTIKSEENK